MLLLRAHTHTSRLSFTDSRVHTPAKLGEFERNPHRRRPILVHTRECRNPASTYLIYGSLYRDVIVISYREHREKEREMANSWRHTRSRGIKYKFCYYRGALESGVLGNTVSEGGRRALAVFHVTQKSAPARPSGRAM